MGRDCFNTFPSDHFSITWLLPNCFSFLWNQYTGYLFSPTARKIVINNREKINAQPFIMSCLAVNLTKILFDLPYYMKNRYLNFQNRF